MKFYCVLAPANLVVLCCLFFSCGCQNEPAATKSVTPPQVAHTSPPEARALDGSDRGKSIEVVLKKDALVREALNRDALVRDALVRDNLEQVNWEQDTSQASAASRATEDLMVDTTLDFESEGLGKLNADMSKLDAIFQKASRK